MHNSPKILDPMNSKTTPQTKTRGEETVLSRSKLSKAIIKNTHSTCHGVNMPKCTTNSVILISEKFSLVRAISNFVPVSTQKSSFAGHKLSWEEHHIVTSVIRMRNQISKKNEPISFDNRFNRTIVSVYSSQSTKD